MWSRFRSLTTRNDLCRFCSGRNWLKLPSLHSSIIETEVEKQGHTRWHHLPLTSSYSILLPHPSSQWKPGINYAIVAQRAFISHDRHQQRCQKHGFHQPSVVMQWTSGCCDKSKYVLFDDHIFDGPCWNGKLRLQENPQSSIVLVLIYLKAFWNKYILSNIPPTHQWMPHQGITSLLRQIFFLIAVFGLRSQQLRIPSCFLVSQLYQAGS